MKKLIITFLILFLFLEIDLPASYAQYFRAHAFLGFGPAKTTSGLVTFYYVDESPSQDNLTSTIDIAQQKIGISLGLGIDYVFESSLFGRLGLSGILGAIGGTDLDIGIGYNIKLSDRFFIRPIALLSVGDAKIRLGTLVQNDVYIQVNSKQFYSYEVPVSLSRNHTLIVPQIEFGIPSGDNGKYEIAVRAGYQFPINVGQ